MLSYLKSKSVNLFTLLAIVLSGLVVVGGAMLVTWSFTGKDVLQFNKDPLPAQPKFVKSEENIMLEADYCKLSNATGTVSVLLENEKTRIPVGAVGTDAQPKGCRTTPVVLPIPPQTPPDKYHIRINAVYKTNPLTTISEVILSEDFEVTN